MGHDDRVACRRRERRAGQHLDGPPQEILAGDAGEGGVRVREVLPDVTERGCTEHGIGHGVRHDVARPFARRSLFSTVLDGLAEADGVVPALPVTDTVKRLAGDRVMETVPREGLVTVQTPQGFRRSALEASHRAAEGEEATDDAALLERAGYTVAVVAGDPANIKITSPDDLDLAERLVDG